MNRRILSSFYHRVMDILSGNTKTINGNSIVGEGDIIISGSGANWGEIGGTLSSQTDLQTALNSKQDELVSGTNIQTLNSVSLLSGGDLVIDKTFVGLDLVDNTSDMNKPVSTAQASAIALKQDVLVSGTNIKTINSNSLLGSGDIAVQSTLVSGTNIKTINSNSLLGSGDLTISASPSGSNGQIQFNNSGAFGSDANLVWDNTNKRLGIGASPSTSVRLDLRAQGALSTDIAFRVRNSLNDRNLFSINGLGQIEVNSNSVSLARTRRFIAGGNNTDNAVDLSNYDEIVMLGYNNTNVNYRATILGSSNVTSVQSGTPAVVVGYGNTTSGGGTILGVSNSGRARLLIGTSNTANGSTDLIGVFGFSNVVSAPNGFPTQPLFVIGNGMSIPNNTAINNCVFISAGTTTTPLNTFKNDNLLIGSVTPWTTNFDNNTRGAFFTKNGTAPTTLPIDTIAMYSADIVAGNSAPHFRTENGSVIKLYKETTSVASSTFVQNTGNAVNDKSTFGGYTIAQVVQALQNQGLL